MILKHLKRFGKKSLLKKHGKQIGVTSIVKVKPQPQITQKKPPLKSLINQRYLIWGISVGSFYQVTDGAAVKLCLEMANKETLGHQFETTIVSKNISTSGQSFRAYYDMDARQLPNGRILVIWTMLDSDSKGVQINAKTISSSGTSETSTHTTVVEDHAMVLRILNSHSFLMENLPLLGQVVAGKMGVVTGSMGKLFQSPDRAVQRPLIVSGIMG